MALPLPNVVSNVGPGGPLATSMRGLNALQSDMLGNQIKSSEADYAPYTNYSNAVSKIAYANYLPFQIRAQVLSNPMIWMALKDNPQAMQAMMSQFGNSLNDMQNMPGGASVPMPSSRSNGLLGALLSKLGGGKSSANAMQQAMPQQGNNPLAQGAPPGMMIENPQNQIPGQAPGPASPLIPGTQGGLQGIFGSKTAPFYAQAYKPGQAFVDPNTGNIISTPTNETVTAAQTAILAAKRVAPQLEKLADAAGPFLNAKGQALNQLERGYNFLFNPKNPGELPTKYAEFQSLLQSSPEALVKSYGLRPTNESIERMQKVINTYFGETASQYKSRILKELESIRQEQIAIPEEQLSQGFNLSSEQNKKQAGTAAPKAEDIAHTAKKYGMTEAEVKKTLGLQ